MKNSRPMNEISRLQNSLAALAEVREQPNLDGTAAHVVAVMVLGAVGAGPHCTVLPPRTRRHLVGEGREGVCAMQETTLVSSG